MNNQKEEFRDIPNYEGLYQVSDLGRVKSLSRLNSRGNRLKERILSGSPDNDGYLMVNLHKEGKGSTKKIHKLVAVAFLGHIPCGMKLVINHIDIDNTNNKLNNLEITTNRINCSKKHLDSTSSFTGVCWDKGRNKWICGIDLNGKRSFLGRFVNEIDASNMYQKALLNLNKYNGNYKDFRDYLRSL